MYNHPIGLVIVLGRLCADGRPRLSGSKCVGYLYGYIYMPHRHAYLSSHIPPLPAYAASRCSCDNVASGGLWAPLAPFELTASM